jgi:hypothetical protein
MLRSRVCTQPASPVQGVDEVLLHAALHRAHLHGQHASP